MQICAYLNLKGRALEAITLYGEIFRAEPEYMTYADMPPDPAFPVTEAMKPLVMHGALSISKDQTLMFSDDMRPGEGEMGNAFTLGLMMDGEAEQRRIFSALAEGGTVLMPLQQTFWSVSFGTVKDRFGVIWHLNICREPGA